MMLLPYLVTLVALMGLGRASPIAASEDKGTEPEKRDSSSCYINGLVYRHGEVFTLGQTRCIKYRCMHGSYDFHEEGCDAFGQCWRINQHIRHKCRDYRCESHQIGGGFKQYQVKTLTTHQQLCEDIYGQCRHQGERMTYTINGVVRHNCQCHIYGSTIRYNCQ